MIRIEHLSKVYPRQQTPALDEVSLTIPEGSIFGLLGPNGAGKTTLISILVGLQKKSGGGVWFDGEPLEQNLAAVRAMTGFVPQDLAFYPMLSVAENLAFYAAAFGIAKAARKGHIDHAIEAARLQEHVHKSAQNLSGGLKRRLNLAIGLLNKPRVLFLDEPTVGIDPQSRNFILDTIAELNRQSGMTIIYTSHYMEEVQQLCDTIAIIDHGHILLQGGLQQLLDEAHESRLEFRLRETVDTESVRLLAERFTARPLDDRRFAVDGGDMQQLLGELPGFLQGRGLTLNGIRYGYQSLEELYMHHTQIGPRE